MRQPLGFIDPTFPSYVCKLNKAIYGLKQSPWLWFSTLSSHMKQLGFVQSKSDLALHIFRENGGIEYFVIYVDDISISGNKTKFLTKIIENLKNSK